jgi:translation initiation factor 1A
MPKGQGGKTQRRGQRHNNEFEKRELQKKEDGQEYGVVIKLLGNCTVSVKCYDGKDRIGQIRGKMRKKTWIGAGDTVLLSVRDFEEGRADIIHRYSPEETRKLKASGDIPHDAVIKDHDDDGDDNNDIIFEDI